MNTGYVPTTKNPLLSVWARIVEIWADPIRCMQPCPGLLTAAEIGERVNASTTSVRRAFKKFVAEDFKIKREEGPPLRWKIVFPDSEGKDINP